MLDHANTEMIQIIFMQICCRCMDQQQCVSLTAVVTPLPEIYAHTVQLMVLI